MGLKLTQRVQEEDNVWYGNKRYIDVMIDENDSSGKWRFTGFYGSPYENNKSNSWAELRNLYIEERVPWFVCGDFNEIMYGFEKK
ncbi:reverse transcriptase [Gossypium australe]|uniref:Reverse transcriptase n=1 Tax=Gossypium australe TaxID=47621 RepID=A0A5B6W4B2_9ROSI|nr:reverse transcriptase [Gossypium australe]